MKAEIAVATLSGKAYYMIVNELKRKGISFLSLSPTEPVPAEVKVVITTQDERRSVKHDRVLIYKNGVEPEAIANESLRIVQGKDYFEKLVIGVDPGEVFGVAVLADGKIIETANCFSVKETTDKIKNILKSLRTVPTDSVSVKIGDGVPACKEKLLRGLDIALPPNIVLESVGEAGTDSNLMETKHRRGLRDIVSATRIAGRKGHRFQRRKANESNS